MLRGPDGASSGSIDLAVVRLRRPGMRRRLIIVSVEKRHCWITAPEAQTVDVVLALHVRHAEL